MPVIATEPKRLSDLIKDEYKPTTGYCRKVVTIVTGADETIAFGTVLGTADAGVSYIPCVETAIDGSEVPAAILIGTVAGNFGVDVDVVIAGTAVIALVQGPAIVGGDALVLDASYDNQTKIDQLHADIESNLRIVVGDQL